MQLLKIKIMNKLLKFFGLVTLKDHKKKINSLNITVDLTTEIIYGLLEKIAELKHKEAESLKVKKQPSKESKDSNKENK